MKIKERIHNLETGEVQDIERELTPQEILVFNEAKAEAIALADELTKKQIAKKALLDKLGITEDEAKLLLS